MLLIAQEEREADPLLQPYPQVTEVQATVSLNLMRPQASTKFVTRKKNCCLTRKKKQLAWVSFARQQQAADIKVTLQFTVSEISNY